MTAVKPDFTKTFFSSRLRFFQKFHMLLAIQTERGILLQQTAQLLFEQLQANPVIATAGNEEELALALKSDCRVVFLLTGNVLDIGELTRRVHMCGKLCVIHLDLIDGFSNREIAVDAIWKATGAEGIISTRGALIKRAKQLGMAAIQRGFMLDSRSLNSFEQQIQQSKPDFVEILPGLLPKVIATLKQLMDVPIIAGRVHPRQGRRHRRAERGRARRLRLESGRLVTVGFPEYTLQPKTPAEWRGFFCLIQFERQPSPRL